jgi:hypothetical protein
MKIIKTEYGSVAVVEEYGKKKCNFEKSSFKNVMSYIRFLKDEQLLKSIFGY